MKIAIAQLNPTIGKLPNNAQQIITAVEPNKLPNHPIIFTFDTVGNKT